LSEIGRQRQGNRLALPVGRDAKAADAAIGGAEAEIIVFAEVLPAMGGQHLACIFFTIGGRQGRQRHALEGVADLERGRCAGAQHHVAGTALDQVAQQRRQLGRFLPAFHGHQLGQGLAVQSIEPPGFQALQGRGHHEGRHHHGFDFLAQLELQLADGVHILGIDHGQGHGAGIGRDRHDLFVLHRVQGDQAQGLGVHPQAEKVFPGDPELLAQILEQVVDGHEPHLDEQRPELAAHLGLAPQGLF
jgi:hypothetical protein